MSTDQTNAMQFIPDLAILDRKAIEWRETTGRARIQLQEFVRASRTIFGDAYANQLERLVENLDESNDSLLHAEIRRWDYRLEQANEAARENGSERDKALRAMADQTGEINRLISAIGRADKAVTAAWARRRTQVPSDLADALADGMGVAARRARRSAGEDVPRETSGTVVRGGGGGGGGDWTIRPGDVLQLPGGITVRALHS